MDGALSTTSPAQPGPVRITRARMHPKVFVMLLSIDSLLVDDELFSRIYDGTCTASTSELRHNRRRLDCTRQLWCTSLPLRCRQPTIQHEPPCIQTIRTPDADSLSRIYRGH